MYTGRPVFDKTGLTGTCDFVLECVVGTVPVAVAADTAGPSIFTAVQEQLGLKLEPATAEFDIVVIDRADRPTPNRNELDCVLRRTVCALHDRPNPRTATRRIAGTNVPVIRHP